eukprot:5757995-Amphidinium_carterae.1
MAASTVQLPEALRDLGSSLKELRAELSHLAELRQKRFENRQALVARLAARINDGAASQAAAPAKAADDLAAKRTVGIAGVSAVMTFDSPVRKSKVRDHSPEELGGEEKLKELVV